MPRLTKQLIDRIQFDTEKRTRSGKQATQQIAWDTVQRGLGIRLQPGGAKSFVVKYRTQYGRTRIMAIGPYGEWTLEQARDVASDTRRAAKEGADPAAKKKADREAETLAQFADVFLERHAKVKKKSWKTDEDRLRTSILPKLGSKKLAEITRADVSKLHASIGRKGARGRPAPIQANRAVRLLTKMRACAIEWGYLPEDAPSWTVSLFSERSRDRWVQPDELPHLLAAIDAEDSPYVRGLFLVALLTGLRRGELLTLQWHDIDLERGMLRLGDTKAGRPHVLPLSSECVAVLRSLPRQLGNPHVFASEVQPGRHVYDVKRAWDRVRARTWLSMHPDEAAGLHERAEAHVTQYGGMVETKLHRLAIEEAKARGETLRLHDVRRTTGSMLAMSGASLPLIGQVLNHSNPSTTAIYARLTQDAPRVALEQVAEQVRAARGA